MKMIEEIIKIFGKENLVETVEKKDKKYYTFILKQLNNFQFITYSEQGVPVCTCSAEKISSRNGRNNFLNIPLGNNKSIYVTDLITHPREIKKGFATALLEKTILELEDRKVIHATGFSEEGFNSLYPKYIEKGYQEANINKKKLPKRLHAFTNWIYKEYK